MNFFDIFKFKGEAAYRKNVNEYNHSRLKNRDCDIDKKTGTAVCNRNGKIKKYRL